MYNFIFLDVDGVLNSKPYLENHCDELSDYHLQNLSEIYHSCDCKIVLCSTWKELWTDPELSDTITNVLRDSLENGLEKYNMSIFDFTPDCGGNRPKEIAQWLSDHFDEVKSFVILDDDFPEEDYEAFNLNNNLVHTYYFCRREEDGGLQKKHVDKAIQILEDR